jgi:nucleoside-diphosphate-sugar epimerase
VYGIVDCVPDAVVSEHTSLERFPDRRGNYAASKFEAEGCVREFMTTSSIPTVILRPGIIYGPGSTLYTGMIGFSFRSLYLVIGNGHFVLPLVYVDHVVDAILLSLEKDAAAGQILNVVDPEPVDKQSYMNQVIRRVDTNAWVVYLPYSLVYSLTWLQERLLGLMRRRPLLSCYRLTSSQRRVTYDCREIGRLLGWKPRFSATEAMNALVASVLVCRRKEGVNTPTGIRQAVTAPSHVDGSSDR